MCYLGIRIRVVKIKIWPDEVILIGIIVVNVDLTIILIIVGSIAIECWFLTGI